MDEGWLKIGYPRHFRCSRIREFLRISLFGRNGCVILDHAESITSLGILYIGVYHVSKFEAI